MSITIPTLMRNQKAGRNTHTMATQLICSQMPVIGIHSSSCSADEEKEASNRGDIVLKKIPNLNKINDGKRLYYNPNSNEKAVFNNIKKEFEGKFNIQLTSRDLIIKQLIATLTHGDYINYSIPDINLVIIRSDIKNFYPSINKHELYRIISRTNILSNSTIEILKPMFFSKSVLGVPLGLPFSSVLAEIYLERFDLDIYSNFTPTFYFRYVDDLIIIKYDMITKLDLETERKCLEGIFAKHSLTINRSKTNVTSYFGNSELSFNYLGYQFNSRGGKLIISISEEKILKIENKIKQHFYTFKKSNRSRKQFWILYYKVMNSIYGITSVDKGGKIMHFGLGYSYRFINDENQVIELIKLVKGLIFSCKLSSNQTSTLLHLVSYEGEAIKILQKRYDYTALSAKQMSKIKNRLCLGTKSCNISRIFYVIYK